MRTPSYRATGEKVSKKSTPCSWKKLLKQSQAFFRPLSLIFIFHTRLWIVASFGRLALGMSSQVLSAVKASYSFLIGASHLSQNLLDHA